jgi:lysozyme family protein
MVDERTGLDFPFFQNQLADLFGEPDESGPFARGYLRQIDLGEFAGHLGHVELFHHQAYFGFYGNYVLEEPIKQALRNLCARGLAQELRTFDGCFNIRPMKSSGRPSVHSWGLAVDLNAAANPFQSDGYEPLISNLSPQFVSCFLEAGFEWGGLWQSCHDAMHFQLPWTKDWRQVSGDLKPIPFGGETLAAGPKPIIAPAEYSQEFLQAVGLTLSAEGGFSNRPLAEDPGGATNLGVTQGLLDTIGGWNGKRNVRQLSEADAVGIYFKHFWQRYGCDKLPWPLSCVVFDHAVNAGAWGPKVLQAMLNEYIDGEIGVDGGIGPATLAAMEQTLAKVEATLQAMAPRDLALRCLTHAYLFRRLRDYANRPGLSVRQANMSGWTNRVCNLEEKVCHGE